MVTNWLEVLRLMEPKWKAGCLIHSLFVTSRLDCLPCSLELSMGRESHQISTKGIGGWCFLNTVLLLLGPKVQVPVFTVVIVKFRWIIWKREEEICIAPSIDPFLSHNKMTIAILEFFFTKNFFSYCNFQIPTETRLWQSAGKYECHRIDHWECTTISLRNSWKILLSAFKYMRLSPLHAK